MMKKQKNAFYFVLPSVCTNIEASFEVRLLLSKKINQTIYFVLPSVCTNIGFAEVRLHLSNKNKKVLLFCIAFGLH